VVPKRDGVILAGTTVEKAGFDASTTPMGERDIAGATEALMPEIASYPVLRTTAGLRPGSPDGLPFLGPLPGHPNVILAAGHHRNGILLAPITANIVTGFVTGRKPPVDISPFLPSRALASR
jgi:glycine oxidase